VPRVLKAQTHLFLSPQASTLGPSAFCARCCSSSSWRRRLAASSCSFRASHGGLVQTQDAWNATYNTLAAPHHCDTTALRRRLLRLSVRLWWHPY